MTDIVEVRQEDREAADKLIDALIASGVDIEAGCAVVRQTYEALAIHRQSAERRAAEAMREAAAKVAADVFAAARKRGQMAEYALPRDIPAAIRALPLPALNPQETVAGSPEPVSDIDTAGLSGGYSPAVSADEVRAVALVFYDSPDPVRRIAALAEAIERGNGCVSIVGWKRLLTDLAALTQQEAGHGR